jgi:hypothetical protein
MSTSARAQELAEQLLGLEATRTPLPAASSRHFGAGIGEMVRDNKKAVMIGGALLGAVVIYWGYKKIQAKKADQKA